MKRSRLYSFEGLMDRLTSGAWCVVEFGHGFEFVQVIHRDYGKRTNGK